MTHRKNANYMASTFQYATAAEVRNDTALQDATNVSTAYIEDKLSMAEAIINGMVGTIYITPFATGASTPPLIKAYTIQMAQGIIFAAQFGGEAEGTGIDGQKMIDFVMKQLKLIQTGAMKIFDSDGTELSRTGNYKPAGYPNQDVDETDAPGRSFETNQVF